ncbi:hypothetical protein [Aestuariivirga litoralis]|uniref:hypothetical protein n=1 Tax=Aestuariivirga litoralis TaxID=2650924 RepID=UPI0018C68E90|nr:hypothetical protein [Aestuariivirga litoralis]MBG1233278.1 hypothetical protein [Aestuariivirga litoralis]
MFIRCAFFEGKVRPGQEKTFHEFVSEKLVPLWTQFPGAEEVRVLSQKESDTESPHYAMVLSIKYPSMAAIERALASDVRFKSRDVTGELIKMFDGRIFHTVFDLRHDVKLAD